MHIIKIISLVIMTWKGMCLSTPWWKNHWKTRKIAFLSDMKPQIKNWLEKIVKLNKYDTKVNKKMANRRTNRHRNFDPLLKCWFFSNLFVFAEVEEWEGRCLPSSTIPNHCSHGNWSFLFTGIGIKVITKIILTMYLIAFKDVYELPFLSLETYKVLEKVGM